MDNQPDTENLTAAISQASTEERLLNLEDVLFLRATQEIIIATSALAMMGLSRDEAKEAAAELVDEAFRQLVASGSIMAEPPRGPIGVAVYKMTWDDKGRQLENVFEFETEEERSAYCAGLNLASSALGDNNMYVTKNLPEELSSVDDVAVIAWNEILDASNREGEAG